MDLIECFTHDICAVLDYLIITKYNIQENVEFCELTLKKESKNKPFKYDDCVISACPRHIRVQNLIACVHATKRQNLEGEISGIRYGNCLCPYSL